MFLISGLGNPGEEYSNTRHNAGFIIIDYLAQKLGLTFTNSSKFNAELLKFDYKGDKIVFAKPLTYMNNSGIALGSIARYYRIDLDSIIVVHDELDLKFGEVRFKIGGSSAGHNGIKSIDSHIGKDYSRVRVGIKEEDRDNAKSFVLSRFSKDKIDNLEENIAAKLLKNFSLLLSSDLVNLNKIFKGIN